MKTTIHDVAKLAGVSSATVSHVMNGTRRVTAETEKRVKDAIIQLHYFPNASARSFKTGHTNLIGFIVPDISNVYFSTLIGQIENEIALHGYNLLIVNTNESIERESHAIINLTSGLVDGIILASTAKDYSEVSSIIPDNYPILFIDREIHNCVKNTITISSNRAVYEAVNDLIKDGHKKIGFIAGLSHLSTTQERLSAYIHAFDKNPSLYDPSLLCYANSMRGSAQRCLDQLIEKKCTAIIVSNSIMTDDVLSYMNFNHIDIHSGISIVGFVDSPVADYSCYAIPIIEQPTLEMGRIAGKQIIQLINKPDSKTHDSFLFSVYRRRIPQEYRCGFGMPTAL